MSKSSNIPVPIDTPIPNNVVFEPKAEEDFYSLDRSQQREVLKAIIKVAHNPAPNTEGGYGKPLRKELAGCCKIKLKHLGIRIVYEYIRTAHGMDIIVIAMREDDEVYRLAAQRRK